MIKHYLFGGSTWARTLQCPAWAIYCMLFRLKNETSDAAQRGTQLHAEIESMLRMHMIVKSDDANYIAITENRSALAVAAYKQCAQFISNHNTATRYYIEKSLCADKIFGGTADLIVHNKSENKIIVMDFKFGAVAVDVINNAQLYFYAALFCLSTNDTIANIEFVIIQPTIYDEPQQWTANISDVHNTQLKIQDILNDIADAKQLKFNDGPQCNYCPALGHCPKTKFNFNELFNNSSIENTLPDFKTLTNAKKIIGVYENQLTKKLLAGETVSGFGLKPKRAVRQYSDEKEVEKIIINNNLGDAAYDKKLKSPAQLEKMLGAKTFNTLFERVVVKKSTGMTLTAGDTLVNEIENKIDELKKIFGDNNNDK